MGELLALNNALLFAIGAVIIRRVQGEIDSTAGHLISVLVNVMINGAALAVRAALGPPLGFSWGGFGFFLASGVFTTFLGRIFWIRAIQSIGPSRAGSFKTAQLALVFVLAIVLLGEEAPLLGVLGALLILGGLLVLTYEPAQAGDGPERRLGVLFGWGSAASFAFGNLGRKVGLTMWSEVLIGASIGAAIAGIATLVAVPNAWRRVREAFATPGSGKGILGYSLMGLVTSGAQISVFGALSLSPVWVVNLIAGSEVLMLPLISMLVLRGQEIHGRRFWTSVALVILGVAAIALR